MGCFVAFKNGDDPSLPSLRSILATKQRGLPPLTVKNIKETNFCFYSPNVRRARSKLLRSVSLSFARARPRALPGSTLRNRKEDEEKETVGASKRKDDEEHDDERYGCFLKIPSRQSSARFVFPAPHSGPIPSSSDELSSPPLLFPLPLPPGHTSSNSSLSYSPAASTSTADAPLQSPDDQPVSGPLPLPCPTNVVAAALRKFSLDELAAGCHNFSDLYKLRDGAAGPVYKVSLKLHSDDVKETEATVARTTLCFSRKKWKAQVQSLARLAHPNLCKIIGFCYEDANSSEMQQNCKQQARGNGYLVFESAANCSVDGLMYHRGDDQPPIDWSTRLKIAIGAAEGLAFLHDRGLKQIIYRCFKPSCVQVDATFNAKLCEYGLADCGSCSEEELTTRGGEEASEKGHAKGFGLLLAELFFEGFNNSSDGELPNLSIAAGLKGGYSAEAAKTVSDLAAGCLAADPVLRPSMRYAAQMLRAVQSPSGGHHIHTNHIHTKAHWKRRSFSIG